MTFKAIAISRLRMATDGEGVRTLVAAAGCPLRCRYCLNPHSWNEQTPVEEYADHKWNIALETSLNVPRSAFEAVIGSVDKFFVDIKSMDKGIYSAYTGGGNGQVIENLAYLLSEVSADQVVVRVPYIPGYTEDEDVELSIKQLEDMGVSNIDCFTYYVHN